MPITSLQKKNKEAVITALEKDQEVLEKYLKLDCTTLWDALAKNHLKKMEIEDENADL
jgi:hypothetical protein